VKNEEAGLAEQALRIVRRRKWVILQAIIAIPLIAFVFSLSQTKEYTATATLLFRQPPSALAETSIADPTREAATNGELVGLPVVAEKAAEQTEGLTAGEIGGSVEVSPSLEAETAAVSATTPDPELSAKIANAYARAYISFRREADRGQVQNAIELAEGSLEELTPERREGTEGAALNKQLDELRLTQALQTGGAELVQPAGVPSTPSAPETKRNVGIGLVLGILLGFLLALLVDRLDRRVRSTEELEEIYDRPILARIPRTRSLGRGLRNVDLETPEGDSFRVLRTNLRYLSVDRDLNTILIASPQEGDGKSTISQGLAMTMAEMGDDVVVVEADMRKPGLRRLGGEAALGLSDVLAGAPVDSALYNVNVGGQAGEAGRALTILPSGQPPPNPSELLESDRMREVLDDLQQRFGVVILDSPALGAVSDALALVPLVAGIVVIAGLGATDRDAASQLSSQLTMLEKRPLGLVVNFAESERAKYSHYYRPEKKRRSATRS
jgi:succinoglycan biosynthesis transport protein ExoP